MHTLAEVDHLIAANLPHLPSEDCPLALAHGRVLRGAVLADRDLPPYDRVTMDGFALRSAAVLSGQTNLRVVGLQAAGMVPLKIDADDTCIEIATGAVLPAGADCVVPYEETQRNGPVITLLQAKTLRAGSNVHRRGSDHAAGSPLLTPGVRLTGREIAAAAACGVSALRVAIMPRVAVISTGDELVEVETRALAAHQIRRSNDHALRAALMLSGCTRVERFHLRDVRDEILEALRRVLLEFDVVILTGGVSKGKFDFLPSVLGELGVTKKVHGVAQRPGKPFWFGVTSRHTPVFALPGNPVSTYVCFRRHVLPALGRMMGLRPSTPEHAVLSESVTFRPPLTLLLPVAITSGEDGRRMAKPMATNTSGDFAGLMGTDGFVELPAETVEFPAGTVARFWPW